MEKINPDLQEHVCFYNACIRDLKEAHPDLTDEKLMEILKDIDFLNTKSIAIKALLWPFGISSRELLFAPLARCFNIVRRVGDNTTKFVCKLFSIGVDLLYTLGVFYFMLSWFSPGRTDVGMLFLPLGCSFIYYMASRFFNYTYLVTEVEWYYHQKEKLKELTS